jgi:Divergent InlB B-repeat domain
MKKNIISAILFLFVSFSLSAQLGVNNTSPDPSAVLDVKSNTKGLLIPRMTTAERNSINTPANGLQIFNTTTNCLEIFANSLWQSIACGCTVKPKISPIALQTISNASQITWIWNLVGGATGYKYNTVNDYNTAIDNGASQVFDQTGLTCGPQFRNLYVWSYNACGATGPTTLIGSLKFPVNVAFTGTGGGTVQSSGNEFNCSTNCSADISCGSTITLTATPNANSAFMGWSGGGCTGTGQCITTISATTNITANFEPTYTLTTLKERCLQQVR